MQLKSIISLSGQISSGKSYVADLVSKQTGFPVASFGGYLKYYCQMNNLSIDRKTLQDKGEAFIKKDPQQFLTNVINHFKDTHDSIILDGIRHKVILKSINELTIDSLSIFVDADQKTRYKRYSSRNKDSDQLKNYNQFIEAGNHTAELEIDALKPLCDLVIDSQTNYSFELATTVQRFLKLDHAIVT